MERVESPWNYHLMLALTVDFMQRTVWFVVKPLNVKSGSVMEKVPQRDHTSFSI